MNQNYIYISIDFRKKIVEHYVLIKNHNSKFKQFQHPESNIILNIMILTFLTSLIYLDMYFKSKVKKPQPYYMYQFELINILDI